MEKIIQHVISLYAWIAHVAVSGERPSCFSSSVYEQLFEMLDILSVVFCSFVADI